MSGSDYNTQRRSFLAALLAGLAAPAQADMAPGTPETCPATPPTSTLRAEWQNSEARRPLLGRQGHRAGRAPLYDAFMAHFWDQMDKLTKANEPQTLDDMLAQISGAFASAHSLYGRAINSHGITTLLVVNSGFNNMWRFHEVHIKAADVAGTAWRSATSDALNLFSDFDPANERYSDSGRSIGIRFQRGNSNFIEFAVVEHLGRGMLANGSTQLSALRPAPHNGPREANTGQYGPSLTRLTCRP